MSDPALHVSETPEKPVSRQPANGAASNGAEKLDAPPPPLAESAADAPPDDLATNGQPAHEPASSNGSALALGAANADSLSVEEEPRRPAPSLTRGDLTFVTIMLAAVFILTLIQLYRRYGWDAREIEVLHPAEYQFTLDINSATWVEWLQLDGVGEVLARRIIEYREQHGPFRSIDDLKNVPGIGDATLEKMRPHLRLDSPPREIP